MRLPGVQTPHRPARKGERLVPNRVCIPLLWIAAASGLLLPASALPGGAPASAVDPRQDARLARRLTLRSEGIPVRWVLKRLSIETRVGLEVAGTAGDERLVAFVPDAPLAEVMLAIAD